MFHKNLKEIEVFFTQMSKRIDSNPIISQLLLGILSRESIRMSDSNSLASGAAVNARRLSNDSHMLKDINLFKDLEILSQ